MFVEGTLRWQVTEDCPWDLLMALALRDLGHLDGVGDPVIPRLTPAVAPVLHPATGALPVLPSRPRPAHPGAAGSPLAEQWQAWFEVIVDRERRAAGSLLQPPHFAAFDRAIELQDLILEHFDEALLWATERHDEYARASAQTHARRAADIVDVVRDREHELRRQAGYFRLDLSVLPLEERGAWIVGPHSVILSTSLRDDSAAFRAWFAPVVAALV